VWTDVYRPAQAEANQRLARKLAVVADRYRQEGITVEWDASLMDWAREQHAPNATEREIERLLKSAITPHFIPWIQHGACARVSLRVQHTGEGIQVIENLSEQKN
jgi:hypothetical protein